jgi:hypothetical protein
MDGGAHPMKPLTVCCVWVKGAYPYTAEYVVRLERMARRFIHQPFRFVCLTDQPTAIPTIETVTIATPGDPVPAPTRGIWSKVELFNPFHFWNRHGDRVLFLDLDVLVVADIDAIVSFPAPLALTEDALVLERAHQDEDRYGRKLVRRFNSSVIVFDGGTQNAIFTQWTPQVAQRLSTDQDWIGEFATDAASMPLAWFPRISRIQPPWPTTAKVVLVKKPKNHEAVDRWPWFEPAWGGWA